MWTPKRILMMAGGVILAVFTYAVYSFFLGGIDGLPPLPAAFLPNPVGTPREYVDTIKPETDRKLAQAFGDDCPELLRSFKIQAPQRGLVLAFDDYEIVPGDGRLKLTPFSVAIFKDKHDGCWPEINSVRCKEAYLRFDEPIKDLTDIGNHRIVGAELRGDVTAVNNRRTPLKSDDVQVDVISAPVFFDDKEARVWTDGFVQLLDMQTQPEPTKVRAKGMELHLSRDTAAAGAPGKAPAAPRPKPRGNGTGTTVNGVERIVLHSNVEMHLWVDSSSGFLSGGDKKEKPRAAAKGPADRARVIIKTPGDFTYDLPRDLAVFTSSPPGGARKEEFSVPPQVSVIREHVQNGKMYDQLICDRLELQFRRKDGPGGKGQAEGTGSDREIDRARATARAGEEVKLAMDTENLDAHGSEFIYCSPRPGKGPETILRGTPMWAVKDAHVITAQELHLVGADARGEGQQGTAQGPGQIDLLDRKDGTNKVHQYHALWKDTLVVTKDREGERVFDLLTFTGDAVFTDDEHHQEMRGDKLQVWLEPPPREGPADPKEQKQAAPGAPRQRPHKVEAFEHVDVRSPELNVRDCDHLIVRFKDGPAPQLPAALPPAAAPPAPPAAQQAKAPGGPVEPGPAAKADVAPAPAAAVAAPEKKADPSRPPIDLWARRVAAYVLRVGSKSELQEVVTEGGVHVHQDGSKPEDKGVDIKGETLNLVRHPEGDVLVVFGDARGPAQLQLGELYLAGPKVTINQKDNMAEVDGAGAMRMPSNSGLDGGPAKKPGSYLTIHWNKDMLFNGKDADYHGGVQAYQDDGSLRCQTLQVTLDRVVSLKEGQKGGQAAKVEKLVCDRQVYVADLTRGPRGEFLRYERLLGQQLTTDNQQGPTVVEGPGKVYLLQVGQPDPGQAPGARPAAAPAKKDEQIYLTRVDFQGRLFSFTKDKIRTTKFYDDVDVYYLPADNPDVKIEVEHLPKGGLYLRCQQMTIFSKPMPDGKTGQYMRAERNVSFRSQDFYGTAPVVKYSQPDELIIFEGVPGNPVNLFRSVRTGGDFQRMSGLRILYHRRTGEFQVKDGGEITGTP